MNQTEASRPLPRPPRGFLPARCHLSRKKPRRSKGTLTGRPQTVYFCQISRYEDSPLPRPSWPVERSQAQPGSRLPPPPPREQPPHASLPKLPRSSQLETKPGM